MTIPTTVEELEARILATPPRNAADRHFHALLRGELTPSPEMRPITFADDDIEALREYVAEEVRLNGGLSDMLLMRLIEMDRSGATHEAAMDILDAAPRLSDRPLI